MNIKNNLKTATDMVVTFYLLKGYERMTKELLLELLEKELDIVVKQQYYYRNEFKVTNIEQAVELGYSIETLETKFELIKEVMNLLKQAKIEEGPTFIHRYINKKRYLKFIDDMVKTIKIIGIEIPEDMIK